MKIWINMFIISIQFIIYESSQLLLNESSNPFVLYYSSKHLLYLNTINSNAYISQIELSNKTQYTQYNKLNFTYSYEVNFVLTTNNDIIIVYGDIPTICLINNDEKKQMRCNQLNAFGLKSRSYTIVLIESEKEINHDIIILGGIFDEKEGYCLMILHQENLIVYSVFETSIKLQFLNCFSIKENSSFFCLLVNDDDVIVHLFQVDQYANKINQRLKIEVEMNDDQYDSSFNFGVIINMNTKQYIGCLWSTLGYFYCLSIESINKGTLIDIIHQTNPSQFNCTQLNYRTFALARITDEKFILSCKANSLLRYQTNDISFKSPSVIVSVEIGDYHFLNIIFNEKSYSILFLYSIPKQNSHLLTITLPQCKDYIHPMNTDSNDSSNKILMTSLISNMNISNSTYFVFTFIPSNINILDDKNTIAKQNELYVLNTIKYIRYDCKEKNTMNVNYYLIDNLLVQSDICSLIITNCYSTCLSCHSKGSISDHQCTLCIQDHYFLEGTSNCYHGTDPPDNYYFNSTSLLFEKCFSSCKQCFNKGISSSHNCLSCKENFYSIDRYEGFCYYYLESVTNYYFDELLEMFKQCSSECKNCFDKPFDEDTNCIECSDGLIPHPNDNSICVRDCSPYTWYIDIVTWRYTCTNLTSTCPNKNYPILDSITNECLKYCKLQHEYYYNNNCIRQCPNNTYIDYLNRKCYDKPEIITLDNMKEMILALPKYEHFFGENFSFYIYQTPLNNSNIIRDNAILNNLSYIEFEECLNILKRVWNIPEDQYLFVSEIELITNETTNNIRYKVFKVTGEELDLKACSSINVKVNYAIKKHPEELSLPLAQSMNEIGVDIFDPNDLFFNSICINFSSINKKDVIIMDRRNDFYKNISFCEPNCTYLKVNLKDQRVECACAVKYDIDDIVYSPNIFQQDFESEFVSSNYEVFICYNLVFNVKLLKNNIGNYFIFVLFMIHFGVNIYYIITGVRPIIKKIRRLLKSSPPPKIKPNPQLIISQNNLVLSSLAKQNFLNQETIRNNDSIKIEMVFSQNQNCPQKKESKKQIVTEASTQLINQPTVIFHNNWINDEDRKNKKTTKDFLMSKKKMSQALFSTQNEVIKHDIQDFEEMKYEEAIEKDTRSFLPIYYQMIKSKQILICLLFNKQLLFKYLYFSVFLLGTTTDFFFNALFFTDEFIHQGYVSDEGLSFWITLPKSILSFIITALLLYFLEFLTSSKVKIKMKKGKKKIVFYRECNQMIRVIKFKLKFYFLISFFAYALYWYYISAFCAVFQNSQVSWIQSSFVSFGISMIIPFITCLTVVLFRFLGLRYKTKYIHLFIYMILF